MSRHGTALLVPLLVPFVICLAAAGVQAQGWPEIFDPLELRTLNLEMTPGDWQTIQQDESLSIEVPAQFWLSGETPMLVAVRRKSGDPLHSGGGFTKVSLKIDINELVPGQTWHELKKLSLENGDDQDVVSEGLGWQLHRLASAPGGYGYPGSHAAWVEVHINSVYTGVYLSAEQRDKQFLRNLELYTNGSTWLYKMSGIGQYDLKVGAGDSPTFDALCYEPFHSGGSACASPPLELLVAELTELIDLQGMFTLGAVDAFTNNGDALFSHGKNCYFADFLGGRQRMYFPWDLDSVLGGGGGGSIYPTGSDYATVILGIPQFRAQYTGIMWTLLLGPLRESVVLGLIDALEPVLTPSLAADPNNQIEGSVAEHFDGLRGWVTHRMEEAFSQLDPPTGVPAGTGPRPPVRHLGLLQNPVLSRAEFRLDGVAPGALLQIYDPLGRLIARLPTSGTRLVWQPGSDAGAGVYFARLRSPEISETIKLVLAP